MADNFFVRHFCGSALLDFFSISMMTSVNMCISNDYNDFMPQNVN